ncbi:MAG: hypothetical protein ACE5J7_00560 [Candidatus Aenigmatarchaeota archaeon]
MNFIISLSLFTNPACVKSFFVNFPSPTYKPTASVKTSSISISLGSINGLGLLPLPVLLEKNFDFIL